jgi:RNA polymerase sigma factor (sigma-70 family)
MGHRSRKQTTDEQITNLIQLKARNLAYSAVIPEWEMSDFQQELSVCWLENQSHYSPECGDLLTFADIVLNHRIDNLIALHHAAKRDIRLCAVSLDECIEDEDGTPMTRHEIHDPDLYFRTIGAPERGDATRADFKIDLEPALRSLSPKQRELCRRLSFEAVTEIAKEMGVTRETVYVWKRRLRDVFTRAGLAIYLQLGSASDLDDFVEKDGDPT